MTWTLSTTSYGNAGREKAVDVKKLSEAKRFMTFSRTVCSPFFLELMVRISQGARKTSSKIHMGFYTNEANLVRI